MTDRLLYEPLQASHADELAAVLLFEQVYAHISERPPTPDEYRRRVGHILKGSPVGRPGLGFENFAVRLAATGTVIGTLETTLHDGLAEVAFLFGAQHWGHGYATEGLSWLTARLLGRGLPDGLWATTHPHNQRSVALLGRCGYRPVDPARAPKLLSYEPGDLVFGRVAAA